MGRVTGDGPRAGSWLARLTGRQELGLAAALWRADRPLAVGWWGLLAARGLLPAGFAIATGVLVAAVERGSGLAAPLLAVAVVFILMQVLGPLHTALSANLGDRTAARLYDEMTGACVAVPGIGHLEDPVLAADLQVARDFDRGMTGPPLSISMDFIAGGLVDMVAGIAQACVLFGFAWWAPPALAGGWLATHWLLRESAVWRDRNTEEVRQAQRDADYAYRSIRRPPRNCGSSGCPSGCSAGSSPAGGGCTGCSTRRPGCGSARCWPASRWCLRPTCSCSGCSARPRWTGGWRSAASSPTPARPRARR
jgi:hypothetical protein